MTYFTFREYVGERHAEEFKKAIEQTITGMYSEYIWEDSSPYHDLWVYEGYHEPIIYDAKFYNLEGDLIKEFPKYVKESSEQTGGSSEVRYEQFRYGRELSDPLFKSEYASRNSEMNRALSDISRNVSDYFAVIAWDPEDKEIDFFDLFRYKNGYSTGNINIEDYTPIDSFMNNGSKFMDKIFSLKNYDTVIPSDEPYYLYISKDSSDPDEAMVRFVNNTAKLKASKYNIDKSNLELIKDDLYDPIIYKFNISDTETLDKLIDTFEGSAGVDEVKYNNAYSDLNDEKEVIGEIWFWPESDEIEIKNPVSFSSGVDLSDKTLLDKFDFIFDTIKKIT